MTAVELRVHGVGGSTAEALLNCSPDAQLVAGDNDAGFYISPGHPELEGYCWGNLTSGAASRALWLLMLPFTLVNASFWMGPRRWVNETLVRLLSLSLTATALLSFEGVGSDLLGWQCAALPSCRDRHTWLSWLGHGTFATPARRLTVGSAVPLSLLLLLWWLSSRTAKYERALPHTPGGEHPLSKKTFWYGERQVVRLRQLHISVGAAVLCLGIAWPLAVLDQDCHGLLVCDVVAIVGAWVVMVVSSVAVAIPSVTRRDEKGQGVTWPRFVRYAAIALLVATVALALIPPGHGASSTDHSLPGYPTAVTSVFVAQIFGVLVLAAALVGRRVKGTAAHGFAQPVFGGLGLLFGSVFAAGLAIRAADYLDGGKAPTSDKLTIPVAYTWASLAMFVVAVLVVLVLAVVVPRRWVKERKKAHKQVLEDYAGQADVDGRVNTITRARVMAGFTDFAVDAIGPVVLVCLLAAGLSMGLTVFEGKPPFQVHTTGVVHDVLDFSTLAGTWLVSGFAAGLVLVGYRSYKGQSLRKHVGILWDLGTFWPRAAHPLAPPCYVERCLPDLTTRIAHLVEDRGGVVVSAHSQGTVIAAALMWQLPREVLDRVRLITYGSPLLRLYGRVYGAWFSEPELLKLRAHIRHDRWTNLWRTSDFIGGKVVDGADQRIPRDPPLLGHRVGDPSYEKPHGHFDYERTPQYEQQLKRMRDDL